MAHITIDLPTISNDKKRKLATSMIETLSEITGIDISEISLTIYELPEENIIFGSNIKIDNKKEKAKETDKAIEKTASNQSGKKTSFFKEIFP